MSAPQKPRRGVSPLFVLGAILLAAGLAVGGYLGWQLWGTNLAARSQADADIARLQAAWAQPDPSASAQPAPTASPSGGTPAAVPQPQSGQAAWLIRIPKLGEQWPIVAGVEPDDLAHGVGWYPNSALPGQVGNFALAGHRITHGEPFRRLLELKAGDHIVIETRGAVFTYELISAPGELTVQDTDSWVLDPVPGKPDVAPTEALITLTTCEDLFRSPDRSVGFGRLISTETR